MDGAAWGGISLGALVLVGYGINRQQIFGAAEQLFKTRVALVAWTISAVLTAVSFLAIVGLFAAGDTPSNKTLFVVGLYVFMSGAIAWSWVVSGDRLTLFELAALWVTATGSIVILAAVEGSTATVPAAVLAAHHVLVDGIWWPLFRKPRQQYEESLSVPF